MDVSTKNVEGMLDGDNGTTRKVDSRNELLGGNAIKRVHTKPNDIGDVMESGRPYV